MVLKYCVCIVLGMGESHQSNFFNDEDMQKEQPHYCKDQGSVRSCEQISLKEACTPYMLRERRILEYPKASPIQHRCGLLG
jgi:hypothetical protein